MEEIDVNPENLIKLGVTPEIIRDIDKFTIWMTQNENFFYDARRNKIVLNKKEIKSELSYVTSLLKSEYLKNGYTIEEYENINKEILEKLSTKAREMKEVFDDEINFKSYLLETITRSVPKISELKDKIFENYFDELIGENINEQENQVVSTQPIQEISQQPKPTTPKKASDKWHAFLYLIENKVYDRNIPKNLDDKIIKSEVEEIGKERCKNSGQGFYRNVKEHEKILENKEYIKHTFGKNWKNTIIELSNNNPDIIDYLKSFKT